MIRVTGHFGEWMQGRLGADGPVALITLPCAEIGVTATQLPGAPGLSKRAQALISPGRAQAFLRDLGCALPGLVDLAADSPAGAGTGMSTGALVALARLAGADEAALPAACITAEGASDPLMLPAPDRVLWASRRGRVLAPAPPIPAALIVGGLLGPAEPTNPQDGNFPDITDLWAQWQTATTLPEFAALASRSAIRTTRLRGPAGDPMADLARDTGALGHIRAHTGAARGLVFAPDTAPDTAVQALARAGLRDIRHFRTGGRP